MPLSYAPLWQKMREKGVTTYDLKVRLKIGGSTYNRLKAEQYVSTHTIELLCEYLDCEVQEVICRVQKTDKE